MHKFIKIYFLRRLISFDLSKQTLLLLFLAVLFVTPFDSLSQTAWVAKIDFKITKSGYRYTTLNSSTVTFSGQTKSGGESFYFSGTGIPSGDLFISALGTASSPHIPT
ncbi:MAG: hypothetical protein OEW75_00935, partial [Cyclobacteriaceae bacterium]|nr:hypothetical protein [Cyclobacteriaceae bacterium]